MVICDECHHVAAFAFEKILCSAEAKYVYGLSTTPTRQDGHHPILLCNVGLCGTSPMPKVRRSNVPFPILLSPRLTRTHPPNADNIQDIYTGIAKNEPHNALIVSDIQELLREGHTPIVLTQRRDHAIALYALLQEADRQVFLLLGSDSQKEKRAKLTQLKVVPPETPFIIVATGKYIAEGFDEPRLDTFLHNSRKFPAFCLVRLPARGYRPSKFPVFSSAVPSLTAA